MRLRRCATYMHACRERATRIGDARRRAWVQSTPDPDAALPHRVPRAAAHRAVRANRANETQADHRRSMRIIASFP
ncbi:hypothetical protein [Burkholderia sp. Z1]|uniref:hypothetical protein n=1 Tax=Burkholderia sp. Z1 TaxID=2759039 RepID=UPI0018668F79|nr:hypothetical protein [Burkholderia sp. Z1]